MIGKQRPFGLSPIPSHANINPRYSLRLSVIQTPSTGLRHPSLEKGDGMRCSECVSNGERGIVERLSLAGKGGAV